MRPRLPHEPGIAALGHLANHLASGGLVLAVNEHQRDQRRLRPLRGRSQQRNQQEPDRFDEPCATRVYNQWGRMSSCAAVVNRPLRDYSGGGHQLPLASIEESSWKFVAAR